MRKKIIGMVSILFVLGSVFTGCGTGAAAGDGAAGSRGQENETGIVCYVGHGFWDGSLDPVKGSFSYGYDFISNGLVRVNPKAEYEGDLAESWEISEDSLAYTYH